MGDTLINKYEKQCLILPWTKLSYSERSAGWAPGWSQEAGKPRGSALALTPELQAPRSQPNLVLTVPVRGPDLAP